MSAEWIFIRSIAKCEWTARYSHQMWWYLGRIFYKWLKRQWCIREQRVGIRWTRVYKEQLPVFLETAIAGRLFLTARLHLSVGRTGARSFGDI